MNPVSGTTPSFPASFATLQAAKTPPAAPRTPSEHSALEEAEETLTQTRLEAQGGDQQAILKLAESQGLPAATQRGPGKATSGNINLLA